MNACPATGKVCHDTRRDAERAIEHVGYPTSASAFLCEHCGCWHWGNRLRSATRKQRQVAPTVEESADE